MNNNKHEIASSFQQFLALQRLAEQMPTNNKFLLSLVDFYNTHNYLTVKQCDAVLASQRYRNFDDGLDINLF